MLLRPPPVALETLLVDPALFENNWKAGPYMTAEYNFDPAPFAGIEYTYVRGVNVTVAQKVIWRGTAYRARSALSNDQQYARQFEEVQNTANGTFVYGGRDTVVLTTPTLQDSFISCVPRTVRCKWSQAYGAYTVELWFMMYPRAMSAREFQRVLEDIDHKMTRASSNR